MVYPAQLKHQKNQWDANRDIPLGKVADVVSKSPKRGTPVIQKEDHWHTEKDVPEDEPPQTRYQKKQWDAQSDIPPGVVQLSPFGQKEFFTDSNEEWPSTPHGSSPKKTWTGTFVFDDGAGVKRGEDNLDSPLRQLLNEKDSQQRAPPTAHTSPSTERISSPVSTSEPADSFFEDKSFAPYRSKQLDASKDIPRGKVRGIANLFGGSPTKESSTDFVESGSEVESFIPSSQASTQRSNTEKTKLDDADFVRTASSNEGMDPWIVQMAPSSQLFPEDESKWGASVTKSSESNDWESGKDWLQSTSFGNDMKGADEESTMTDKTNESKSHASNVKAVTSEPLSPNDALTQESSLAGSTDTASSPLRNIPSLTAKPEDDTSAPAEVEKGDVMMEEATKGKKRRGFLSFFGGVSSLWTPIVWAGDAETCLLT